MKRNLILLLTLLLVLLGFLAYRYWQYKTQQITLDNVDKISRIQIVNISDSLSSEIELRKISDTLWMLEEDVHADADLMKSYFEILSSLQIKSPVSKGKSKELRTAKGIDKGKLKVYRSLFGGLSYPMRPLYFYRDSLSFYVQKGKNGLLYEVYSPLADLNVQDYFSTRKEHWRNRRILHCFMNEIDMVQVDYPADSAASFMIARKGEGIQTSFKTAFDTLKVYDFLSAFTDIYTESFENNTLSQEEREASFSSLPMQKIKLSCAKGKNHELHTYLKYIRTDDKQVPDPFMLYAILPQSGDTLLVSYYMIDRMQRKAAWFLIN